MPSGKLYWTFKFNHVYVMVPRIIAFTALLASGCAFGESTSSFTLPSGVAIRIVEEKFRPSQFKIDGCTEQSEICRINRRPPFGFYGWPLPSTYVKSITASYQGKTYSLDASQMFNAWGSRFSPAKGAPRYFGGKCIDSRYCAFRGLFADAGAAFVAEWIVVDGVSFRTVITNSIDVVNLFMENIDPPEYD